MKFTGVQYLPAHDSSQMCLLNIDSFAFQQSSAMQDYYKVIHDWNE